MRLRSSDVVVLVAKLVKRAHAGTELRVVVTQLRQHVERRHIVSIVVEDTLQPRDVADRPDGRAAELERTRSAIGSLIGVDLRRLVVEQQVIVAEVRTRDVPVEVLGLPVECGDVGQQKVQSAGEISRGVLAEVGQGWRARRSCVTSDPCSCGWHSCGYEWQRRDPQRAFAAR